MARRRKLTPAKLAVRIFQYATLVIAGAEDKLREPGYEQAMSRIPDVRIRVIGEAGHLVNIERADVVNQAMIAFLGEGRSATVVSAIDHGAGDDGEPR